jgi:transcriptional regulator GlxA family with amidase domain
MILGRSEAIYECSHDHDGGDECLALEFAPGVLEDVASSTPGCRGDIFPAPVLGPATRALALVERLAAPGHRGDFDEAVHAIASTVLTGAYQTRPPPAAPHASHRARVEAAIARIEARCAGPVKLAELASEARLSPFHFLRVFRSVTGTTPHQYVLGARLRRASRLLVETSRPVTRIALDVGFEDLSNFVRTFHRAVGCSPGAFRRRA